MKLPIDVVKFAAGDTSLFDSFVDYWHQYVFQTTGKRYPFAETDKEGKHISFSQKEDALNQMLVKEVSKRSGVDISSFSAEQLATHPLVGWFAMNIVSQMIDAVLPETIIDSTAPYAEIKTAPWGQTAVFDVKSRDLFPVSKAGRLGMREAEMHKAFQGQVVINPEPREITVGVSLFRVLTGQESLAEFTAKAIRSMETEMTKDIYNAFVTAMAALSTTASTGLQVSGYTKADLVTIANKVSAFSGGAKAIVLGTKLALANILPDDPNYRYDVSSDFVKLGYVRTISGIDTFEIPQVADWTNPFATYISDDYLWVIAPGTDKIVKCVIGGSTISNVSGTFDTATLQQNATMMKLWKAGVVTSAIGGCVSI